MKIFKDPYLTTNMPDFDEDVIVRDANANERIRLQSNNGDIVVRRIMTNNEEMEDFRFDALTSTLNLGANGNGGDLRIIDGQGRTVLAFNSGTSSLFLGTNGNAGDLRIRDALERDVLSFDAAAHLTLGANGNGGDLRIRNDQGHIVLNFASGNNALELGNMYDPGGLQVRNGNGGSAFSVDAEANTVNVGASDSHGAGHLRVSGTWAPAFSVDARNSDEFYENQPSLIIRDGSGREVLRFKASRGSLWLGNTGEDGDLVVTDNQGNTRIHLDGQTGQINSTGADCAEEFLVSDTGVVDPGTVLVINDSGSLSPCEKAYDKKVAGIVSGANNYSPGIVLDKKEGEVGDDKMGRRRRRMPLSLSGKTFAKVDAISSAGRNSNINGAIEIGDLLTTSNTIGHAMKVSDYSRAPGSVIGKALGSLKSGTGIIPVLVSLQ